MADQLSLYNEALTEHLGERALSSLAEDRSPRRALDSIWDRCFADTWLQQGQWNFAMRSVKIDYSPSVEPPFGYQYAFDHPEDMVRVAAVCQDEYFQIPLLEYQDEGSYWFANHQELYVRYVSNDASYGLDLTKWPANFTAWVASDLALRGSRAITGAKYDRNALEKESKRLLTEARSVDAQRSPTRRLPSGRWVNARGGSRTKDSVHAPH